MSSCNSISAQGTTLEVSEAGSPTVWQEVCGVKSYSGFDGQRTEIDTTCLTSTAKEYNLGLEDFGNFQADLMVDFDCVGQQQLRAAKGQSTAREFKLTYPTGDVALFSAFVKGFDEKAGVDEVLMATVQLRITGPVSRVAA